MNKLAWTISRVNTDLGVHMRFFILCPLLLYTSEPLHNRKGTKYPLVFCYLKEICSEPPEEDNLWFETPKTSWMSCLCECCRLVPLSGEQKHKLNHIVSIIKCKCYVQMLEHPAWENLDFQSGSMTSPKLDNYSSSTWPFWLFILLAGSAPGL